MPIPIDPLRQAESAHREAVKAIHDAEHWIRECSGNETATALAVIAVAKSNLALEARLAELATVLLARLQESR